MASGERKPLSRSSKRKLVRWNDNLDELLLLTIQSICNQEGVKIPWAEVAKSMGNNVTEGAIVQHLAKIRTRRLEKDKEVPPPLRRGGIGGSSSPKSREPLATPISPTKQSDENAATSLKKPSNESKLRGEKRAVQGVCSEGEDYNSSDSDKEWGVSRRGSRSTKKSKPRKAHKKRKSTSQKHVFKPEIDEIYDDGAAEESVVTSLDAENEMVAVGAGFLQFVNREQADTSSTTSLSEDDEEIDTNRSLIVKLKTGVKNLRQVKHKGIGLYQHRDPEQRWQLPSPGPDGEKWGFSKDYYGPVPKTGYSLQNPGLLRGEWPMDVAMRQYNAPQAARWSKRTREPDSRLVHPADYIVDKRDCEPQLKLHRKLRAIESPSFEPSVPDHQRPPYREYMNSHRELPGYHSQSWDVGSANNATTSSGDYTAAGFLATHGVNIPSAAAPSQSLHYQANNYSSFDLGHPQTEDEMETHQDLEVKLPIAGNPMDHHSELPMENNGIGLAAELANEDPHDGDFSVFDTDFESFTNPDHDIFSFD